VPDKEQNSAESKKSYSLLIYPAQCNYSGARFPWHWAALARRSQTTSSQHAWLVAVDASAYASTSPIDLSDSETAPDFLVLSFYKTFGFPTGLGALIVRKSLAPLLRKRYFGGGTCRLSSSVSDKWHSHAIEMQCPR
jgi:molybdenum cofactor sulfurtransferase